MALLNATPSRALAAPTMDARGREGGVVIVKATFEVKEGGRLVRAEEPAPVRVGDVLRDPEDPKSSARYPSDVCVDKHGADVVVVGEAFSRAKVACMDVAVRVCDRTVPLRV